MKFKKGKIYFCGRKEFHVILKFIDIRKNLKEKVVNVLEGGIKSKDDLYFEILINKGYFYGDYKFLMITSRSYIFESSREITLEKYKKTRKFLELFE